MKSLSKAGHPELFPCTFRRYPPRNLCAPYRRHSPAALALQPDGHSRRQSAAVSAASIQTARPYHWGVRNRLRGRPPLALALHHIHTHAPLKNTHPTTTTATLAYASTCRQTNYSADPQRTLPSVWFGSSPRSRRARTRSTLPSLHATCSDCCGGCGGPQEMATAVSLHDVRSQPRASGCGYPCWQTTTTAQPALKGETQPNNTNTPSHLMPLQHGDNVAVALSLCVVQGCETLHVIRVSTKPMVRSKSG